MLINDKKALPTRLQTDGQTRAAERHPWMHAIYDQQRDLPKKKHWNQQNNKIYSNFAQLSSQFFFKHGW